MPRRPHGGEGRTSSSVASPRFPSARDARRAIRPPSTAYVSLPDRQDGDGFRLVPAWVAGIGEARERPADVGQAADPYIAYTYAVVDAVSGRKLSR